MALIVHTRNGADGVTLGQRKLKAAEMISFKSKEREAHFSATRRFAKMMCDKPRLPKQPVYGINNWYLPFASRNLPIGEPVDWMENLAPKKWKLNSVMEDSIGGELPKYKVQIADHYKLNFLLQSA